ncbi:MAG: hypothetical protein U5L75_01615 [Candidatus Campbellbacteria bacterium]|nr:hypothetical protein [Candidatus Campbellbacteria bacterium]
MDNTKLYSFLMIAVMVFALGFFNAVNAEGHEEDADTSVETETTVEGEVETTQSDSENGEGAEADTRDADSDDDGLDDGSEASEAQVEAQDYNSTRSNKPGSIVDPQDPDDDGDGVPTVESRAGATKEIDKASPKIMRLRGIDKSTPKLFQSLEMSGAICPAEEDCDDSDSDVEPGSADHVLSVRASGEEMRGASEEAKAEVRARLQEIDEITDANDFGVQVASAALSDENVVDITTDDEQTEVRYKTRIHLFGFIPTNTEVTARAESGGEVEIDYPWYGFLSRKGDQGSLSELVSGIRAAHDGLISISVEEEGAPVNRREDTEDDSE